MNAIIMYFETIIDSIIEMDWLERILAMIVIALISIVTFYLIDSVGLETTEESVIQIDTRYSPPSTSVINTTNNGITTVQIINKPERHYITAKQTSFIDTKYDIFIECPTDKSTYNMFEKDGLAVAKFSVGRLTGRTYCEGLE